MNPPRTRISSCRGAALVVVLSVLILLTAIVVAMTVAMRMERQAAHYYSERARADLFAAEGVEAMKAVIQTATAPGRGWISMPGRIVSWPTNAPGTVTNSDLFSGPASAGDTNAPDLNRWVFTEDEKTAISGSGDTNSSMPVAWIYVFQDGTRSTNATVSPDNPIIGRYAFWTDDESSRINLNTARKSSGNTNVSSAHPSRVDLPAIPGLTEADADMIYSVATNTPFNSPDEARRLPGLAAIFSTNRFALTHYNHSPDLDPWGNPKTVLTTHPHLAGGRPFIDILRDPNNTNADPGALSNLDYTKVVAAWTRLQQMLRLEGDFPPSGWPYGKSFAAKYGSTNTYQIALDMIEYVRSAESALPVVEAIRVLPPSGGDPRANGAIIGTVRRPMITEIGLWMSDPPANTKADMVLKVEIYLPPNYGLESVDLSGQTLTIYGLPQGAPYEWQLSDSTHVTLSPTSLTKGNFLVASISDKIPGVERKFIDSFRIVLSSKQPAVPGWANATPVWELIPPQSPGNRVLYKVDAASVPVGQITSAQVSDPRVNKYQANWVQTNSTFGTRNFNWSESVAAVPPQDETGAAARENSLFFPAPKGLSGNTNGIVNSVAELGHILTGAAAANVPWRTFRLRPTPAAEEPPDWALFDLFSAPVFPTNNALNFPGSNTVAGHINLNGVIQPFTTITRPIPRAALFNTAVGLSDAAKTNIIERNYSGGAKNYGGTNGYLSAGELAQIAGVSTSETAESHLKGLVDLASVRGNVFRVHTIGQAIKQAPSGKLNIQAEKSAVVLIERQEDAGSTKCRTVFWKTVPF